MSASIYRPPLSLQLSKLLNQAKTISAQLDTNPDLIKTDPLHKIYYSYPLGHTLEHINNLREKVRTAHPPNDNSK